MADYGALARQKVQQYLPKFEGFTRYVQITYRRRGEETYDTTTGTITPGTDTDYTLKAMFLSFGFSKSAAADHKNDDLAILNRDRKCLFAAEDLPIDPKVGDYIVEGGQTWRVMAVNFDPAIAHRNLHVRPLIDA